MKALSDAQINALVVVNNNRVELGFETLAGANRSSLRSLDRLGLIKVQGVRKTHWQITTDGKKEIKELVARGQLTLESP